MSTNTSITATDFNARYAMGLVGIEVGQLTSQQNKLMKEEIKCMNTLASSSVDAANRQANFGIAVGAVEGTALIGQGAMSFKALGDNASAFKELDTANTNRMRDLNAPQTRIGEIDNRLTEIDNELNPSGTIKPVNTNDPINPDTTTAKELPAPAVKEKLLNEQKTILSEKETHQKTIDERNKQYDIKSNEVNTRQQRSNAIVQVGTQASNGFQTINSSVGNSQMRLEDAKKNMADQAYKTIESSVQSGTQMVQGISQVDIYAALLGMVRG